MYYFSSILHKTHIKKGCPTHEMRLKIPSDFKLDQFFILGWDLVGVKQKATLIKSTT